MTDLEAHLSPGEPAASAGDVRPAERRPSDAPEWEFFSAAEAQTVEAVAECVVPTEHNSPGASEAMVVRFIDRALSEASDGLRAAYRSGVEQLDGMCRRREGVAFAALPPAVQEQVLGQIDDVTAVTAAGSPDRDALLSLANFFALVREHTLQGMFCDPEYGGNHEMAGWRLVGFPGAQWGYTAEEMRPGFDATSIPLRTLADLRREHPLSSTADARTVTGGIND